jgi:hypothetical protein
MWDSSPGAKVSIMPKRGLSGIPSLGGGVKWGETIFWRVAEGEWEKNRNKRKDLGGIGEGTF